MLYEVLTTDASETQALAAELSHQLGVGDLLVLAGDLGAGKTCFTQGLARGLGVTDRVTSPTFTLANRYDDGRLTLHHLDVYRLDDIGETLDLDLPELLETGITVIEWGEEIDAVLPVERLTVRLLHLDDVSDDVDDGGADDLIDGRRMIRFEGDQRWAYRLRAMPTFASSKEASA